MDSEIEQQVDFVASKILDEFNAAFVRHDGSERDLFFCLKDHHELLQFTFNNFHNRFQELMPTTFLFMNRLLEGRKNAKVICPLLSFFAVSLSLLSLDSDHLYCGYSGQEPK